jgi:acetoin:2,6-dichlorophenolindophenol oxidoreductase subunit alpha
VTPTLDRADDAAATQTDMSVDLLATMMRIRLFEERVQELFHEGLIAGTTHLCQGQEAVSAGAVSSMEAHDYLTITYRGHGHAIARGMSLDAAFAELMGRRMGCCMGVGGSMHLTDFSRGLIGAFAIVGAGLPVAVGAALSAKLKEEDSVALTFFGDGAANIGTFHEAMNMAGAWKLPVVFVIENNLYAEYTPLAETTPVEDLARRADGYGMPGVVVDGQDVLAVRAVVGAAVDRARRGEGPTLVEAKTYRYRGHSRTDPGKYRPSEEVDAWRERDPIELFCRLLIANGTMTPENHEALKAAAQAEVDDAAERAASSEPPTIEEIRHLVYAG